jgi:OmpA-OmpF porin, OOP family
MTPKNAIALLVQTVFVLRMPVLTMLALAVGLTLPSEAGEKTYTAGDIIAHFAAAGDEPVTRGLCVGSDEECGRAEKKAPSFDLEINFAKDSAELDPDAQGKLLQFSLALRDPRLQNLRFAVEGFTDASGPARHNLTLSERRAQSVTGFLAELGIEPSRLEAKGYGATRMRQPDPYDPLNRRVETRIIR